MEFTSQGQYTDSMMKEVVRAYLLKFFRRVGWLLSFAVILSIVSLILAKDQANSWAVVTIIASIIIVFSLYRVVHQHTVGKVKKMKKPECTVTLRENDLSISTELGSLTLPWSTFTEIVRLKTCWLVFVSKSHGITIPTESATPEALCFISEKIESKDIH